MDGQRKRPRKARDPGPVTYSAPVARGRGWRDTVNRVLSLLVMAFLAVWFTLHIQPWLGEALVVVGPFTALALWRIVEPWLKGMLGKEPEQTVHRFLGRPAATELLGAALAVTVLLVGTTSSIYVRYEGAPPGTAEVKVEVLERGNPILAMEVTSYRPVAGRPLLLRTRPASLTFAVVEPPGYRPQPVRLWPGETERLAVPAELDPDRIFLLRVVPGISLVGKLPMPTAQRSRSYLRLRLGKRELVVRGLRFQSLFLGASTRDQERQLVVLKAEELRGQLDAYLVSSDIPSNEREAYRVAWETRRLFDTPRFQKHAKIKLSLYRPKEQQPLVECDVTLSGKAVQTVFLGRPCVTG